MAWLGIGVNAWSFGRLPAGAIYIELSNARIEIHGAADPVSLGIVLECLAQ